MNQKQKIVIIISSFFLGLTVFLPFLARDDFRKKNNQQHLINKYPEKKQNNLQLPKNKKNSSVLWTILIIIGITFVVIIITIFIPWLLRKYRENKYFSGKCRINLPSLATDAIRIDYCPDHPIANSHENFYHIDIFKINNLPNDIQIQNIYNGLKAEHRKKIFINFGKLIVDFFDLLNGYLLQTVFKDKTQSYPILNDMWRAIRQQLYYDNEFSKENVIVYHKSIGAINQFDPFSEPSKINFIENKDPITFFKKIMNNKKIHFIKKDNNKKFFFFKHYYSIYKIIKSIASELDTFFNQKANKKIAKPYLKRYQKIMNIKQKIDHFLKIENNVK